MWVYIFIGVPISFTGTPSLSYAASFDLVLPSIEIRFVMDIPKSGELSIPQRIENAIFIHNRM